MEILENRYIRNLRVQAVRLFISTLVSCTSSLSTAVAAPSTCAEILRHGSSEYSGDAVAARDRLLTRLEGFPERILRLLNGPLLRRYWSAPQVTQVIKRIEEMALEADSRPTDGPMGADAQDPRPSAGLLNPGFQSVSIDMGNAVGVIRRRLRDGELIYKIDSFALKEGETVLDTGERPRGLATEFGQLLVAIFRALDGELSSARDIRQVKIVGGVVFNEGLIEIFQNMGFKPKDVFADLWAFPPSPDFPGFGPDSPWRAPVPGSDLPQDRLGLDWVLDLTVLPRVK